jgi:hypothetical protein
MGKHSDGILNHRTEWQVREHIKELRLYPVSDYLATRIYFSIFTIQESLTASEQYFAKVPPCPIDDTPFATDKL